MSINLDFRIGVLRLIAMDGGFALYRISYFYVAFKEQIRSWTEVVKGD